MFSESGISKLTGKVNDTGTGLPSFVPGVHSGDMLSTLIASASSFSCAPLSTFVGKTKLQLKICRKIVVKFKQQTPVEVLLRGFLVVSPACKLDTSCNCFQYQVRFPHSFLYSLQLKNVAGSVKIVIHIVIQT